MTHKDLVKKAAGWLRKRWRCVVIVTEMASSAREEPDAIGWMHCGVSYLIECKASRRDFLGDKKKPWRRRRYTGMGTHRYYFAPKGLIKEDELPRGWGLAEVHPSGKIRVVKTAGPVKSSSQDEMRILVSSLRRIGQKCPEGIRVQSYSYEFNESSKGKTPRATLGVAAGTDV